MNKEIENLIRKSMGKDVEIKMLDRELNGEIISKEIILEILKELTDTDLPDGVQPQDLQTPDPFNGEPH